MLIKNVKMRVWKFDENCCKYLTILYNLFCFIKQEGFAMNEKIALYGFNNLTKTLSFNIYDVCYAKSEKERKNYLEYIDEQYNAQRLTNILCEVTNIIGAHVLNIAKQDYDPQGASVTLLISEDPIEESFVDSSCNLGKGIFEPETIVAHLDKSHVTVHTYPEFHPDHAISTFRVDIDVSTCGTISPLKALDYLIGSFDSDIITIDYRVRGFTRDMDRKKHFMDHHINSIQNYINRDTLRKYDAVDINVHQSNIFHTKMMIQNIELQNYLFNTDKDELKPMVRREIYNALYKEMIEIFSGSNIYDHGAYND